MMKRSLQTRFLSLILTLALSFSLCPAALADLDPSDYSDLKEDYWAYDSIMYCSEWNIVTGFEDGTFRPEDEVTYAQFIAMLARTFYSDEVNAVTATAENPWYYPYMKVSRDHNLDFKTNIVNRGGWPEVVVANDPVNRYEMASILRMAMVDHGKSPRYGEWQSVTGSIKDYDQFPARDDVQIYDLSVPSCYYVGVLTGMSDGNFHGEESMTRAQACVVITRMQDVINGETPAVPSTPQQPAQPETPTQPEPPQQTGSGLLANGQPATVENVQAILDQIKREYPEGTTWGAYGTPNNNWYTDGPSAGDETRDAAVAISKIGSAQNQYTGATGSIDLKYACGGWMAMVSERIFGKTGAPAREVTDITKARPGDIVVKTTGTGYISHVGIFLSYKPSYTAYGVTNQPEIITCDGNMNSFVGAGTVDWCYPNTMHGGLSDLGSSIHILTRYPD